MICCGRATKGTAWREAARATMFSPTCPSIPPSASTACPPTMTQWTRAIIANTAASLIAVVCGKQQQQRQRRNTTHGEQHVHSEKNSIRLLREMAQRAMIPFSARLRASCCPRKSGAPSATITWNFRFFAASTRKRNTVLHMPKVRIT